jgi:hypothetical protein
MQNAASPSSQSHSAILRRFRTRYALWTTLLAGLTIGALAWLWNRPDYAEGFTYIQSVPILLVAALLVNGISFYFQDRFVRTLLQRPQIGRAFRVPPFVLRFYVYNLITALVLCVVFYFPLLYLLFFHWIYPILLWLTPYHLLTGILLGRDLQRSLQAQVQQGG